jgi:putative toxin-antitoxin system antitoxin component (TIGR02293 family)
MPKLDHADALREILAKASDVLVLQQTAEEWLSIPVVGLGTEPPIDFIGNQAGADQVAGLLTRTDYGVYT